MNYLEYIIPIGTVLFISLLISFLFKHIAQKIVHRPVAFWRCYMLALLWSVATLFTVYILSTLLSSSMLVDGIAIVVISIGLLSVLIHFVLRTSSYTQALLLTPVYLILIGACIGVLIALKVYVVSHFIVSGESMYPAYTTNNYVVANLLADTYQSGDVVVFEYPQDPSKVFISRIIGMPGDTLEITSDSVRLINERHPNGTTLLEPYASGSNGDTLTEMLREGEYFVMGDNREKSSDSRQWGILTADKILGKVWPQR